MYSNRWSILNRSFLSDSQPHQLTPLLSLSLSTSHISFRFFYFFTKGELEEGETTLEGLFHDLDTNRNELRVSAAESWEEIPNTDKIYVEEYQRKVLARYHSKRRQEKDTGDEGDEEDLSDTEKESKPSDSYDESASRGRPSFIQTSRMWTESPSPGTSSSRRRSSLLNPHAPEFMPSPLSPLVTHSMSSSTVGTPRVPSPFPLSLSQSYRKDRNTPHVRHKFNPNWPCPRGGHHVAYDDKVCCC